MVPCIPISVLASVCIFANPGQSLSAFNIGSSSLIIGSNVL